MKLVIVVILTIATVVYALPFENLEASEISQNTNVLAAAGNTDVTPAIRNKRALETIYKIKRLLGLDTTPLQNKLQGKIPNNERNAKGESKSSGYGAREDGNSQPGGRYRTIIIEKINDSDARLDNGWERYYN